jgi:murein DD-endopeptidase MepM/ murein hydrolase activator NlpD
VVALSSCGRTTDEHHFPPQPPQHSTFDASTWLFAPRGSNIAAGLFAGCEPMRVVTRRSALATVGLSVVIGLASSDPARPAGVSPAAPPPASEVSSTEATTTIPLTTLPATTIPATTIPATAPTVPVVPASNTVAPLTTLPQATTAVPIPTVEVIGTPTTTTTLPPGVIPIDGPTTSFDPNASTTTSFDPNSTTTSLVPSTIPVLADLQDEDATSEEPPRIATPVLPAPKVPVRNRSLEDALKQLTVKQQSLIAIAQKRGDLAVKRVDESTKAIEELREKASQVQSDIAELNSQAAGTRTKLRTRALAIFTGEDIESVQSLLNADNTNDLARNLELVSQSQERDRVLLKEFSDQKAKLQNSETELKVLEGEQQIELETVLAEQAALTDALEKMQRELASITSGASIALGGFVFPVTAPFNFADTMGAPRMTGSKYEHRHEGTDIFGAYGSPVLAVSRGVIVRMGVAVLGGNKLWLKSTDGTEYYYAHLSAFVEGVTDGTIVEAGDVIGFLGDTGNARGTPPHVHFEVHPGGGGPVNPYPFLAAVRDNDASALLKASQAAIASSTPEPVTVPGQIRAGIGLVREVALGAVDATAAGPTTTQVPGSAASQTTLPFRKLDSVTTAPA